MWELLASITSGGGPIPPDIASQMESATDPGPPVGCRIPLQPNISRIPIRY